MPLTYQKSDFPVACSMIAWIDATSKPDSLHLFCCYWMSFNNIYVTLAEQVPPKQKLKTDTHGAVVTNLIGGIHLPTVLGKKQEHQQIDIAFKELDDSTKAKLVNHKNVEFFVTRVPVYGAHDLPENKLGEKLNGVLNVGRSINSDYPIWSPLDRALFKKVQDKSADATEISTLAEQLLDMLYTVRNNLFHGGKRADDADGVELVKKATPLLAIIVRYFLREKQPVAVR